MADDQPDAHKLKWEGRSKLKRKGGSSGSKSKDAYFRNKAQRKKEAEEIQIKAEIRKKGKAFLSRRVLTPEGGSLTITRGGKVSTRSRRGTLVDVSRPGDFDYENRKRQFEEAEAKKIESSKKNIRHFERGERQKELRRKQRVSRLEMSSELAEQSRQEGITGMDAYKYFTKGENLPYDPMPPTRKDIALQKLVHKEQVISDFSQETEMQMGRLDKFIKDWTIIKGDNFASKTARSILIYAGPGGLYFGGRTLAQAIVSLQVGGETRNYAKQYENYQSRTPSELLEITKLGGQMLKDLATSPEGVAIAILASGPKLIKVIPKAVGRVGRFTVETAKTAGPKLKAYLPVKVGKVKGPITTKLGRIQILEKIEPVSKIKLRAGVFKGFKQKFTVGTLGKTRTLIRPPKAYVKATQGAKVILDKSISISTKADPGRNVKIKVGAYKGFKQKFTVGTLGKTRTLIRPSSIFLKIGTRELKILGPKFVRSPGAIVKFNKVSTPPSMKTIKLKFDSTKPSTGTIKLKLDFPTSKNIIINTKTGLSTIRVLRLGIEGRKAFLDTGTKTISVKFGDAVQKGFTGPLIRFKKIKAPVSNLIRDISYQKITRPKRTGIQPINLRNVPVGGYQQKLVTVTKQVSQSKVIKGIEKSLALGSSFAGASALAGIKKQIPSLDKGMPDPRVKFPDLSGRGGSGLASTGFKNLGQIHRLPQGTTPTIYVEYERQPGFKGIQEKLIQTVKIDSVLKSIEKLKLNQDLKIKQDLKINQAIKQSQQVRTEQIVRSKQIQEPKLIQALKIGQVQIPLLKTRTVTVPGDPPPPPPPFFPLIDFGFPESKVQVSKTGKKKGSKQRFKYTPTAYSITFNIRSDFPVQKIKNQLGSGISVRPLLPNMKGFKL